MKTNKLVYAIATALMLTSVSCFAGWFDFMKSDKPAENKPAAVAPAAKPKSIDKKKLYEVICKCAVGAQNPQWAETLETMKFEKDIRKVTGDMYDSLMKEHLPGMDMNCNGSFDYNSVPKFRRDCVRGYKKYGSDEELKEAGEDLTS